MTSDTESIGIMVSWYTWGHAGFIIPTALWVLPFSNYGPTSLKVVCNGVILGLEGFRTRGQAHTVPYSAIPYLSILYHHTTTPRYIIPIHYTIAYYVYYTII